MVQTFIQKLGHYVKLSRLDRSLIEKAIGTRERRIEARDDIIREGDRRENVDLILSGWAYRYKALENGRRQIIAYLIPGDLCDLRVSVLRAMDHSVGAITPVTIAEIAPDRMATLTDSNSRVAQAFWWSSLVAEAIEREWIVNLGQRSAFERLGHLFCELFIRLRTVGLTDGNSCELPMTQLELGETTGLSTVHVNRTLQELRANGLVILRGGTLTIPDLDLLQRAVLFNPAYLHLDHEGSHLDANED